MTAEVNVFLTQNTVFPHFKVNKKATLEDT